MKTGRIPKDTPRSVMLLSSEKAEETVETEQTGGSQGPGDVLLAFAARTSSRTEACAIAHFTAERRFVDLPPLEALSAPALPARASCNLTAETFARAAFHHSLFATSSCHRSLLSRTLVLQALAGAPVFAVLTLSGFLRHGSASPALEALAGALVHTALTAPLALSSNAFRHGGPLRFAAARHDPSACDACSSGTCRSSWRRRTCSACLCPCDDAHACNRGDNAFLPWLFYLSCSFCENLSRGWAPPMGPKS